MKVYRSANFLELAHAQPSRKPSVRANSQTEKTTATRQIVVRDTSVSRHNMALIQHNRAMMYGYASIEHP